MEKLWLGLVRLTSNSIYLSASKPPCTQRSCEELCPKIYPSPISLQNLLTLPLLLLLQNQANMNDGAVVIQVPTASAVVIL